jgi:hypothetical protein
MPVNKEKYQELLKSFNHQIHLVAVSKTKPPEDIQELYNMGQRDFGENYVQELTDKQNALPKDIRWHFIGHLQSNKVKYIAPFVYLIHGVDSLKLLEEINKQARKCNQIINVLLQVHIAREETKFGLDENELETILTLGPPLKDKYPHVKICGLMGMASFTEDQNAVQLEFNFLQSLFQKYRHLFHSSGNAFEGPSLSMGMSGDYPLAINAGSNLVRIGSLLFGARSKV